jgi:hypothetical protein
VGPDEVDVEFFDWLETKGFELLSFGILDCWEKSFTNWGKSTKQQPLTPFEIRFYSDRTTVFWNLTALNLHLIFRNKLDCSYL